MNIRTGTTAVLTAALACAAPTAATAVPTKVTVRVEGAAKTLVEGTVTTDVRTVDGNDGTGAHKCDGTNGGANTTSGPTATSALDSALKLARLSWAAKFDASFDDFIVNRIGPDPATSSQFWGVAVNGKSLDVGGCQKIVGAGDEVLWAYDLFNKKHVLRATGAAKVRAKHVYTVKVVDTQHGNVPVAGAKIGGKKTNSHGVAKLRFQTTGTKRLKATEATSVRSNELDVKVTKAK
jgi:hypothetical protein